MSLSRRSAPRAPLVPLPLPSPSSSSTQLFEVASHGVLFTPFSRHTRRPTPIQSPTRHRNSVNKGHLASLLQLKLGPNMPLPLSLTRSSSPPPRLQPTPTRRRPPPTRAAPLDPRSARTLTPALVSLSRRSAPRAPLAPLPLPRVHFLRVRSFLKSHRMAFYLLLFLATHGVSHQFNHLPDTATD